MRVETVESGPTGDISGLTSERDERCVSVFLEHFYSWSSVVRGRVMEDHSCVGRHYFSPSKGLWTSGYLGRAGCLGRAG